MMKQECITEIREKLIPATTALTKLVKLRTITSGFAYTPEGDAVRFTENPKIQELKEVLDELGDEKVVVFCNFKAEIEDIKAMLGSSCVTVDGETFDKSQAITTFRSGQVQYLIANEASISHGVTLIEARYMIFYSHSYSAEKFTQARARIRRIGQKGACVYIHLLCSGTIDEIILDVLKNKQDAVEVVRRLMSNGE
jgi:superfamily II DNA or RNA helicase